MTPYLNRLVVIGAFLLVALMAVSLVLLALGMGREVGSQVGRRCPRGALAARSVAIALG